MVSFRHSVTEIPNMTHTLITKINWSNFNIMIFLVAALGILGPSYHKETKWFSFEERVCHEEQQSNVSEPSASPKRKLGGSGGPLQSRTEAKRKCFQVLTVSPLPSFFLLTARSGPR